MEITCLPKEELISILKENSIDASIRMDLIELSGGELSPTEDDAPVFISEEEEVSYSIFSPPLRMITAKPNGSYFVHRTGLLNGEIFVTLEGDVPDVDHLVEYLTKYKS